MTELVAARLAAKVAAPNDGAPSVEEPAGPRLAPGKPVPGPAAWRALERHAANFRLR